jgi:hypothetical protein
LELFIATQAHRENCEAALEQLAVAGRLGLIGTVEFGTMEQVVPNRPHIEKGFAQARRLARPWVGVPDQLPFGERLLFWRRGIHKRQRLPELLILFGL